MFRHLTGVGTKERYLDDRKVGVLYVDFGVFEAANCESVIAFAIGA